MAALMEFRLSAELEGRTKKERMQNNTESKREESKRVNKRVKSVVKEKDKVEAVERRGEV